MLARRNDAGQWRALPVEANRAAAQLGLAARADLTHPLRATRIFGGMSASKLITLLRWE
jgi:hypothetical protein